MALIREIHSLDLPELQPYRTLRRPEEHIRQGIFVAEGEKVVRRMIDSGVEVVSLLMTPEWHERMQVPLNAPVYLAARDLLESIVGYRLHQGIMGVGRIPPQPLLEEAVRRAPKPRLLLALDGLVHAENVGVVVRNAAAFGVQALIHDRTSSSPYLRRSVRNSMGAVFRLPVVSVPELSEALTSLRETGVRVIAAHPGAGVPLSACDLSGDICVVLGNEGAGISVKVLDACSEQAAIPMRNQTDSLNVASACAVFLYEAQRRR